MCLQFPTAEKRWDQLKLSHRLTLAETLLE